MHLATLYLAAALAIVQAAADDLPPNGCLVKILDGHRSLGERCIKFGEEGYVTVHAEKRGYRYSLVNVQTGADCRNKGEGTNLQVVPAQNAGGEGRRRKAGPALIPGKTWSSEPARC